MEKRSVQGNERENDFGETEHSGAAARMLRAVNAAASAEGRFPEELDAAAKALVTELRLANEPPEQVLVQMKKILADAGLRASHGPIDSGLVGEHHIALYRSVIESSIRHYFATGGGPESANA